MLGKLLFLWLIGLSASVQSDACPSDANIVATLENSSATEGVDWNSVVAAVRSGRANGLEEGRTHVEAVAHLDSEEKEEADARFRYNLIARLRRVVYAYTPLDPYTLVYVFAAVADGILVQVESGVGADLGKRFDSVPSRETTLVGCACSTAYIFGIQGLMMALASPFSMSDVPLPFREVPKAALLSGVFLVLEIASAVAAMPIVGFELGGLIVLGGEIAAGLSMDATGFFGFSSKRKIEKGQLAGAMVLAGGLLASAGLHLNGKSGQEIAAVLPFLGLSALEGTSGIVATTLNGALVPYTGNALKAGAVSLFIGTMLIMVISISLSFLDHTPAIGFDIKEWWLWTGGLVGIYGVWCSAWLPKKLGITGYYTVSNFAYIGTSIASDAFGIFGEKRSTTTPEALAVAVCLFGMLVVQFFEGGEIPSPSIENGVRTDLERAVEAERIGFPSMEEGAHTDSESSVEAERIGFPSMEEGAHTDSESPVEAERIGFPSMDEGAHTDSESPVEAERIGFPSMDEGAHTDLESAVESERNGVTPIECKRKRRQFQV